jgi:succinylarginine dihydrolase
MLVELNIDALVGPTHHFGGVGVGNRASASHQRQVSHPRRAALEGLDKASFVASLGIPQYILPPPMRPRRDWLSKLGFVGEPQEQYDMARSATPAAYSAAFSSAFMWAANSATFSPACDCDDNRNHLTVANLVSSWHRSSESNERAGQFDAMWSSLPSQAEQGGNGSAIMHCSLPHVLPLRDEGAANHMRLCDATGTIGFNIFVYGETDTGPRPEFFPARQTLASCQAVARLHKLDPKRTFFLQQHPAAIDAGVFHNDVIATSHQDVLLHHELAFLNGEEELERLEQTFAQACGKQLKRISISARDLSLEEAIASYFFNSQILSPAHDGSAQAGGDKTQKMLLLGAAQCARMDRVRSLIESLIAEDDCCIDAVHYVTLDESMAGGGGPACLRLRVQLPAEAIEHFAPAYRLTNERQNQLRRAIEETYPEELAWDELSAAQRVEQYSIAHAAIRSCFVK